MFEVFLIKTLNFYFFVNKLVKQTAYFLACIYIVYFSKNKLSISYVSTSLSSYLKNYTNTYFNFINTIYYLIYCSPTF